MFVRNFWIFCLSCFCSFQLNAKILEMNHMHSLTNYIQEGDLIIFDIDNTIMEPTQELGSDQWFRHRISFHVRKGKDASDALEKALAEWEAVQNITDVKLVEDSIATFIQDLQKQNHLVMGLTTRGISLATRTFYQLQSLNVDLEKTCFTQQEIPFLNEHTVLLRKGVLFTSGTHKGKALFKLLDLADCHPKRIIFINDKATHLQQVEETAKLRKTPFIGLRYGYLDSKVKNFRADLADLQFKDFSYILSDTEAQKRLKREGLSIN